MRKKVFKQLIHFGVKIRKSSKAPANSENKNSFPHSYEFMFMNTFRTTKPKTTSFSYTSNFLNVSVKRSSPHSLHPSIFFKSLDHVIETTGRERGLVSLHGINASLSPSSRLHKRTLGSCHLMEDGAPTTAINSATPSFISIWTHSFKFAFFLHIIKNKCLKKTESENYWLQASQNWSASLRVPVDQKALSDHTPAPKAP